MTELAEKIAEVIRIYENDECGFVMCPVDRTWAEANCRVCTAYQILALCAQDLRERANNKASANGKIGYANTVLQAIAEEWEKEAE